MRAVDFTTLTLGDNTSECKDSGVEGEHYQALMTAKKPDKAHTKTLDKE